MWLLGAIICVLYTCGYQKIVLQEEVVEAPSPTITTATTTTTYYVVLQW